VNTRFRRFDDLTPADLVAWRALATDAAEPNPFFEPEALLPAARHLRRHPVELLIVQDADGWIAAVPVERRVRYGKLPGPCRLVWENPHGALGTPLVAARAVAPAADALVDALIGSRTAAWAGLRSLGDDGPVSRALRRALEQRRRAPIVLAAHERAAVHGVPVGGIRIKSGVRHEVNRRRRRLAEACGGPVEVSVGGGDDAMVERFLALEQAGWKGAAGTSLLAVPGHGEFFRALCREFRAQDRMVFVELRAGDRLAAARCLIRAGDTAFFFKSAYEEALSAYAPGVATAAAVLERLDELAGVRRVDSCSAPDNAVLNRLMPDRKPVVTLAVPARGPAGLAARGALPAALWVRDRLR
jgi:CelD/BcsL family acetyltransferase involved in cellulose biosynthesis